MLNVKNLRSINQINIVQLEASERINQNNNLAKPKTDVISYLGYVVLY